MGDLLDSWLDKIDMIVHPERRKLTALALISMLRFNTGVVYERFGKSIHCLIQIITQIFFLKKEIITLQETPSYILMDSFYYTVVP